MPGEKNKLTLAHLASIEYMNQAAKAQKKYISPLSAPPTDKIAWRVAKVGTPVLVKTVEQRTRPYGNAMSAPPVDVGTVLARTAYRAKEKLLQRFAERGYYYSLSSVFVEPVAEKV
jgi:hypothetical protein